MPRDDRRALPDEQSWRFDKIAQCEPGRATKLRQAGSSDSLLVRIQSALRDSFSNGSVRLGWEHAHRSPEDHRGVVQFAVTPTLFDWFFNARTGYRAHFRVHSECGLSFNANLIERLCQVLRERLAVMVEVSLLNDRFENRGQDRIPKACFLDSFVPDLAKVWFCTKLIGFGGDVKDLPPGITGPRILLNDDKSWVAPFRNEDDTWLDVKGAFLGPSGPYQPKDPLDRAKTLQATGQA